MRNGSRFILGIICGGGVFFLLTSVQFARQKQVELRNVSHTQKPKTQKEAPKKYGSPIINVLEKVVDKTKGLDPNEKETALDILRKADPLLRKIRAENAKALQRINRPVRLPGRQPPAKKKKTI